MNREDYVTSIIARYHSLGVQVDSRILLKIVRDYEMTNIVHKSFSVETIQNILIESTIQDILALPEELLHSQEREEVVTSITQSIKNNDCLANPFIQKNLDEIREKIDKALKGARIYRYWKRQTLKTMPLIGAYRSHSFSAGLYSSDYPDDALILIAEGVCYLALKLSKLLAHLFVERDDGGFATRPDDVFKKIEDNKNIEFEFVDLLLAFIFTDNPLITNIYIPDRERLFIVDAIASSFQTFVVAHEYGHYIYNHLKNENSEIPSLSLEKATDEAKAMVKKWIQELDADRFGSSITIQVMKNDEYGKELGFMGIETCICVMSIMEQMSKYYTTNKDIKSDEEYTPQDHPPAGMRRNAIIEANTTKEDRESIEMVANSIDVIFEYMQNKLDDFMSFYIDRITNGNEELDHSFRTNYFKMREILVEYYKVGANS